MNSIKLFEIALGLERPWLIKKVDLNQVEGRLDIYLDFEIGYKFPLPSGGTAGAYDTESRTWQHLNFFQFNCFLHARVPRIKNEEGKARRVEVPWARPGSGFTLLFEAFSMLLIESEMPVSKVSDLLKVYAQRIWGVFNHWISKAHKEDVIENLSQIAYDETSSKKGHSYITHVVDLEERRILFASPGKGADCIKKSVEYLEQKDVDISQIKDVCIDMSPAFIAGCMHYIPDAQITFDKFHVTKEVNKAFDDLRIMERKGNDMLKGHKYTFLKRKICTKLQTQRDFLVEMYPRLGEAYRVKELFNDFWSIEDKEEAESYLAFWCDIALEAKIQPFTKVVNTIKAHWRGIVNYINSRITNGILEGINSKIQLAKKRARGYRNISNFINMIYFISGKLKFSYPHYFT